MSRRLRITRSHLLFAAAALLYTVVMAMSLVILAPRDAHAAQPPLAAVGSSDEDDRHTDTVTRLATTPAPTEPGVAAKVNARPILEAAVETIARQLAANGRDASIDEILEELINLEVLAEAAERQGLDRQEHVAAALHLQYTQTLANAYLAELEQSISIDEDELYRAYADTAAGNRALEFRASHILLANEAQALDVIERLRDGDDFAALATTRSIDSTAALGGDLGWVDETTLPGSLGESVSRLAIGGVSETPVESSYGWHVLTLSDTRRAATPPFARLREQLRAQLVQRELAERIALLRADADIQRP